MPYCRNRCTITEMRADCLYLAGKRCTQVSPSPVHLPSWLCPLTPPPPSWLCGRQTWGQRASCCRWAPSTNTTETWETRLWPRRYLRVVPIVNGCGVSTAGREVSTMWSMTEICVGVGEAFRGLVPWLLWLNYIMGEWTMLLAWDCVTIRYLNSHSH